MARGFANVRLGHAVQHKQHGKRANAACATGGFYTNPTSGQSVSASSPMNVTWDITCLDSNTTAVDLYLYAPSLESSLLHRWLDVNYAIGSYEATMDAAWWNSTSSVNLQLSIVKAGSPVFMSPMPAGPVFTATYSGTAESTTPSDDSGVTIVRNFLKKLGVSGGGIAAAVILPLLAVAGVCAFFYLRWSRAKGQEKRKRWTQTIDKRMSTISTDWKSMSGAGANAAIRNSMAYSAHAGNRASAFSFGAIRPSTEYNINSTFGVGNAGIGANGMEGDDADTPHMGQLRSGPRPPLPAAAFGERVSRVSFAADTRPSVDRRTLVSRAFHAGFVAPVPEREDSSEDPMSPKQMSGAFSLTPDDIRARVSGSNDEVDDYMPALSMMRSGAEGEADDYILTPRAVPPPPLPVSPPPTHQTPKSPMPLMRPGQYMSPDAMLREYASRRAGAPGALSPAFPSPVASSGMRILYAPTNPDTPSTPSTLVGSHNPYAKPEDDDEDGYEDDEHPYVGATYHAE